MSALIETMPWASTGRGGDEAGTCVASSQRLDYVPFPGIDDPGREEEFLAPMPGAEDFEARRRAMKAPRDVPIEMVALYEVPLLDRDQEQHLFRQMNYLKYRAARLRDQLRQGPESGDGPSPQRLRVLLEIEALREKANAVKEVLIGANMRLVVSIAKRFARHADSFAELLSDGNLSLIHAVEKFDVSRNFRFSTYASWALIKNFARGISGKKLRRQRFVTGQEDLFGIAPDTRSDEYEAWASHERARQSIHQLLQHLRPREREIVRLRAGLDDNRKMTLEEIGQQFGITKERVRQLNAQAMKKLRGLAERQAIDPP